MSISENTWDPYGVQIISSARMLRHAKGWSAFTLSEHCYEMALANVPPLPHTLSRSRIAQLENGVRTRSVSVAEWITLSCVFGVSPADMLNPGALSANTPTGELPEIGAPGGASYLAEIAVRASRLVETDSLLSEALRAAGVQIMVGPVIPVS